MLQGITVTCFAASYSVALLLEISRLFFRSGVRGVLMRIFALAGLIAHSLYLAARAFDGKPLGGWFDWYLVAAWILAAIYLYLTYYHPKNPFGLFMLPIVLALVGVGYLFRNDAGFVAEAPKFWRTIHGSSLLLGTVVVILGFVAGLMYLMQARQLKQKRSPAKRFRLPSLEWSEKVNGRSILISTLLLGLGLISGVVLNALSKKQGAGFSWSDPAVLSSGLMFVWLVVATVFNAIYRPARQGRKVAYLTVANFGFLVLVMIVLLSGTSDHPSTGGQGSREPGVIFASLSPAWQCGGVSDANSLRDSELEPVSETPPHGNAGETNHHARLSHTLPQPQPQGAHA